MVVGKGNTDATAARRPGPGMPDLTRVIETPTMVVWGEDDVALDLICLDGTERYVRDLAIHRLPGVSHWVQQDAPDAVNRLLQGFLPGHAGPSGTGQA